MDSRASRALVAVFGFSVFRFKNSKMVGGSIPVQPAAHPQGVAKGVLGTGDLTGR
jgi:hypothetical protein